MHIFRYIKALHTSLVLELLNIVCFDPKMSISSRALHKETSSCHNNLLQLFFLHGYLAFAFDTISKN